MFKSVKFQLFVIASLFVLFVAVVIFQMYFSRRIEDDSLSRLGYSNSVISEYLSLEEKERRIVEGLRDITRSVRAQDGEVDEVAAMIELWLVDLNAWAESSRLWRTEHVGQGTALVFGANFLENKRRQAESYSTAVGLCRENRMDEVAALLAIESAFSDSIHESVIAILAAVRRQIDENRRIARLFHFSTAVAVLLAMGVLLLASISIARQLTTSLRILHESAMRVSNGDFDINVKVDAPQELAGLAATFNDMQAAIKLRDVKIREDSQEIQVLNDELRKKVEDSGRTIIVQNQSLKRKNEELEQILYAASHDLRTPLISTQGFSEELRDACGRLREMLKANGELDQAAATELLDGEIEMALNYIANGSKRMELLLEGLLRLSRMGRDSLQFQTIDMDEMLANVAAALKVQIDDAGAELSIAKLAPCQGDPSQMEQVFFNLLINAIKYRHLERPCRIEVKSERGEGVSRYFVVDNGIGIPEEYLERVFHAFFRVDDEHVAGDGVGLAIVGRAVDLHEGRVYARRNPELGCAFVVEIPDEKLATESKT